MSGVKTAVVGSVLALATLAAPGTSSALPHRAPPNPPPASPDVMSGHGELAVIHTHQLYLIGGPVNGVHYVGFGNSASEPAWSHDGKWLSVVITPPPPKAHPFKEQPSKLVLVGPRGDVYRNLTPTAVDVYDVSVAWSPVEDWAAVGYHTKASEGVRAMDHLDLIRVGTDRTKVINRRTIPLVDARYISGYAWAPNGAQLAVGVNRFDGSAGGWHSRLIAIDAARTGLRHTISTATGNVLKVAGWWPDGSGVLTWLDYQGSASLAADGLPLYDITVHNGRRRLLAKSMLQYSQWLSSSKVTNQIAFVAGGDRNVTLGHKRIVVCSRSACHALPQGHKQVSFDPAWSASGRLAFVRDQMVPPNQGCCGLAYVNRIQESGGIKLGSTASTVHAAFAGQSSGAPAWGSDGSMLVVRDDALWLLPPGLQQVTKVVDGLQVRGTDNYYGFVPWHITYAWSDAVG